MALLRNAVANSLKFEDGEDGNTVVKLCDGTVYGVVNAKGEFVPDGAFSSADEPDDDDGESSRVGEAPAGLPGGLVGDAPPTTASEEPSEA